MSHATGAVVWYTHRAMSETTITIGGDLAGDASRRFAAAWHRAERGEAVDERHLSFESWEALKRTLLLGHRPA